jgi:hypothetical protein
MANKINARGQISGMATDLKTGAIHAFLATPVDGGSGTATPQNEAAAIPKVNLPENVRRILMQSLGAGRIPAKE